MSQDDLKKSEPSEPSESGHRVTGISELKISPEQALHLYVCAFGTRLTDWGFHVPMCRELQAAAEVIDNRISDTAIVDPFGVSTYFAFSEVDGRVAPASDRSAQVKQARKRVARFLRAWADAMDRASEVV